MLLGFLVELPWNILVLRKTELLLEPGTTWLLFCLYNPKLIDIMLNLLLLLILRPQDCTTVRLLLISLYYAKLAIEGLSFSAVIIILRTKRSSLKRLRISSRCFSFLDTRMSVVEAVRKSDAFLIITVFLRLISAILRTEYSIVAVYSHVSVPAIQREVGLLLIFSALCMLKAGLSFSNFVVRALIV